MTTKDASVVTGALPGPTDDLLGKLENIYRDLHANPELSMQEQRTSGVAAAWLRELEYDVTEGVGTTGATSTHRRSRTSSRWNSDIPIQGAVCVTRTYGSVRGTGE